MFSSDPGRRQLAESAGFERLVVVTLHRGHTYSSLDAVKEEVAGKAVELVQQGLPHGKQVTCMMHYILDYCIPLNQELIEPITILLAMNVTDSQPRTQSLKNDTTIMHSQCALHSLQFFFLNEQETCT